MANIAQGRHSSPGGRHSSPGGDNGGDEKKFFFKSIKTTGGVSKKKTGQREEAASSGNNNTIHIKIFGQDGMLVHIEAQRDVPMRKVFLKYCEQKSLDYYAMRFIRRGQRVPVRATPDELHLKDGCRIDAMVTVHGGRGC